MDTQQQRSTTSLDAAAAKKVEAERKRLEDIKAAARAYALSSTGSTRRKNRKSNSLLAQQPPRGYPSVLAAGAHPYPPHYPYPRYHPAGQGRTGGQPPFVPRPHQVGPPRASSYYGRGGGAIGRTVPPSTKAATAVPTGAAVTVPHIRAAIQSAPHKPAMTAAARSVSSQPTPATATTTTTTTTAAAAAAATTDGFLFPPSPSSSNAMRVEEDPNRNAQHIENVDPQDEEYQLFVQSLAWDDNYWLTNNQLWESNSVLAALDDDEEEFQLGDEEHDDDDDDDDDGEDEADDEDDHDQEASQKDGHGRGHNPASESEGTKNEARITSEGVDSNLPASSGMTPTWQATSMSPASVTIGIEDDWENDLEQELDWLEEEDMEAAVASLLMENQPKKISTETQDDNLRTSSAMSGGEAVGTGYEQQSAADEEHELCVARAASRMRPTRKQLDQLQDLLQKHYQLLLQQAVLATRTAHQLRLSRSGSRDAPVEPVLPPSCESVDDLAEILDGAVGMLQDLDQNRKDAIRHYIQFTDATTNTNGARREDASVRSKRRLWAQADLPSRSAAETIQSPGERRLTRAQFSKTLHEKFTGDGLTVFAIPGIRKLKETFSSIDKSVDGFKEGNILSLPTHAAASTQLLEQAGASYAKELIPGNTDLSELLIDPQDYLGDSFTPPCTQSQEVLLRRNRNIFTSGEDNLVLRGVNLYGEKQWLLIADRYLPDRSANIVSQRYAKICTLLYKAHGVQIDDEGNLETQPKFDSLDDVDPSELSKIKQVDPPAILNVHRWSLEEDLSLLKVVPVLGNMWAEIAARVLPHRDRGHLRKRYQVLARRVKAAVQRHSKTLANLKSPDRRLSSYAKSPCKIVSVETSSTSAPAHVRPLHQLPMPTTRSSPIKANAQARFSPRPHNAFPAKYAYASTSSTRMNSGAVNQAAAILANARQASTDSPKLPPVTTTRTYAVEHPSHVQPPHQAKAPATTHTAPWHPRTFSTPSKTKASDPGRTTSKTQHSSTPFAMNDADSCAAFELLASGASPGWSQMANLKDMIDKDHHEHDAASKLTTASTMATELAKTPLKRPSSPQKTSPYGDPSSMSLLDSALGFTPEKASIDRKDLDAGHPPETSTVSFFAGVLDRSRHKQSQQVQPRRKSVPDRYQLPSTREKKPFSSTPSRSATAAPSEMSEGLPPFYSPAYAPNASMLTGLPLLQSPPLTFGNSNWGSTAAASMTNGPASSFEYSRAIAPPPTNPQCSPVDRRSSTSSRRSSPKSPFSSSPSSLLPPTPASKSTHNSTTTTTTTLTPHSLFGDGGDAAALMATDLEAISALNSLSHSPATHGDDRFFGATATKSKSKKRALASHNTHSSNTTNNNNNNTTVVEKSLFAKVVGASDPSTSTQTAQSNNNNHINTLSARKKRKLYF